MSGITRTATFWIAVLTFVVSIFTGLGSIGVHAPLSLGFVAARASGVNFPFDAVPVFLTPLTATLVHGGGFHLGFNLLLLVWCGLAVERVLGRGALVFLYVVSAYVSMAAQWAAGPQDLSPVIGASGAISGLLGAYALSFGRPKLVTNNMRLNRWIYVAWLAAAFTLLQMLIGWSAGQQGTMLATPAHIGGFVAGLLLQRPLLLWRYRKA
ncbi:rhomboid family intramembrane serine protease [Sphingomonas sp. LHG3406-1]|uniref:rhomboid family intramembrane serine protease n=1 Tax=Sphingomonas sp. LHG3406-1 TaxID=2804617 RepID=UPI0026198ECD|nr:rhomboid family intramembrane serine protease [Sphingomonas sp. LHG3406-1]